MKMTETLKMTRIESLSLGKIGIDDVVKNHSSWGFVDSIIPNQTGKGYLVYFNGSGNILEVFDVVWRFREPVVS
jgi:hypothetical protein